MAIISKETQDSPKTHQLYQCVFWWGWLVTLFNSVAISYRQCTTSFYLWYPQFTLRCLSRLFHIIRISILWSLKPSTPVFLTKMYCYWYFISSINCWLWLARPSSSTQQTAVFTSFLSKVPHNTLMSQTYHLKHEFMNQPAYLKFSPKPTGR